MDRRVFGQMVILALAGFTAPAWAKDKSVWNGIWTGAWGGRASTSIQISNNRVVRYEYQGAPVPITKQTITPDSVSFGTDSYTVSLSLTGPNAATASFSGVQGSGNAGLTRQ